MNFNKIVCTNIIGKIESDGKNIPHLWTPNNFQPVFSRKVFVVKGMTKSGVPSFRIYPLQKKNGVHPPTFVIGKPDNKYLRLRGTHIVYKDDRIVIFRPIVSIYYNLKYSIKAKDYDYILINFVTFVKHLYFTDYISEKKIDQITKDIEKIEKILGYISSNNENEKR